MCAHNSEIPKIYFWRTGYVGLPFNNILLIFQKTFFIHGLTQKFVSTKTNSGYQIYSSSFGSANLMLFEPSISLQISVYLENNVEDFPRGLDRLESSVSRLPFLMSANHINLITIHDCTMTISSWLQIIQFAPSRAVVTSNRSDFGTSPTSNEECSLTRCNGRISINAQINYLVLKLHYVRFEKCE